MKAWPFSVLRKGLLTALLVFVWQPSARSQPGVWESHGPALSLSVSTVFPDPGDPLRIFVGTRQSGLFFSANGGVNWQQSPPPLSSGSVAVITVHGGRLFVGNSVGTNISGDEYASGFFTSDDGGFSWREIADFQETGVNALLSINDRILVSTDDVLGIFSSDDNGETWHPVPGLGSFPVLSFMEHRGLLYAGSVEKRVYISADSGETWEASTFSGVDISVFSAIDTIVVAGANRDCCGTTNGIYISRDRGETFQPAPALIGRAVFDLMRHGDRLYAGSEIGTFYSPDSGATWLQGTGDVASSTILKLGSQGSSLLAGSDAGNIYKSVDAGISWKAVDFPGTGAAVSSFSTTEDAIYVGTEGAGLFISTNSGDTWFPRQIRASQKAHDLLLNANFFLSYGEGIYRSVDGALTWEAADAPLNTVPVSAIVEHDGRLFAATEDGLWWGSDGLRWSQAGPPLDGGRLNDIFFVDGIGLVAGPGIYTSTDGVNWTSAGLPTNLDILTLLHHDGAFYAGIASAGVVRSTSPQGPWDRATGSISTKSIYGLFAFDNILYAATQRNGLYRSVDGITWTAIGSPLLEVTVNDMIVYDDLLYAATGSTRGGRTQTGLYASADNGLTWIQVQLPDNTVDVLSLLEINGFLYAGGSKAFVTGNGTRWTPLGLGLRTGRINRLTRHNLPGEVRMLAATENGVFLQRIDQIPPVAISISPVATSTFVSERNLSLNVTALEADSVIVSEDSLASTAKWRPFAQVLSYELSPENGLKKIFARFKDLSWNLSEVISTSVTLDTEPPVFAAHQSPSIATPDSTLTITQSASDPNLTEIALYYRRPGEPFSENRRSIFDGGSATIDGAFITPRGLDYRIIASDAAELSDTLRNGSLDFFSLPVTVVEAGLGSSPGLPGGTGGSAFRMISVPMKLSGAHNVSAVFGNLGKNGTDGDWLLWNYQGNGEWTQGPNAVVETGKSYFILLRNGRSLSNEVTGTSVETTAGVLGEIPAWHLKANDWTLIGNPYNTEIDLRLLKLANQDLPLAVPDPAFQVWAYDGRSENNGWTNENISLEPWGGLAVFSTQVDTIVFANASDPFAPPGPQLPKSSLPSQVGNLDAIEGEWLLQVRAEIPEFSDRVNYLGVRQGASLRQDAYDWYEPPMLPGGVSVSFPHPEWPGNVSFATDIRPVTKEGYEWSIAVRARDGSAVSLQFENLESLPKEFEIWLADEETHILRDLRQQPNVSVRIPEELQTKLLRVIIGRSAFVANRTQGLDAMPNSFTLYQNYPNPFNPSTTIRYGLPAVGIVTLKVFDLLGREVLTLEDRTERKAGFYETVVDLSRFGSGVYFYRIAVDGERRYQASKKMLLVK